MKGQISALPRLKPAPLKLPANGSFDPARPLEQVLMPPLGSFRKI